MSRQLGAKRREPRMLRRFHETLKSRDHIAVFRGQRRANFNNFHFVSGQYPLVVRAGGFKINDEGLTH